MIAQINRIKRERNAVILAHNYMTPEIFHGVGDYVGDSLGLAREAARSDAAVIVQAGVHFMAETSKILCPDKRVLIPDLRAGCSLASSITAADVRLMRERHPEFIIEHAVKGMLPKNRIAAKMLTKLRVFAGPKHSHEVNNPAKISV
jgi:quinolinate synthetase A subunit